MQGTCTYRWNFKFLLDLMTLECQKDNNITLNQFFLSKLLLRDIEINDFASWA